jgi:hypothetical protein
MHLSEKCQSSVKTTIDIDEGYGLSVGTGGPSGRSGGWMVRSLAAQQFMLRTTMALYVIEHVSRFKTC